MQDKLQNRVEKLRELHKPKGICCECRALQHKLIRCGCGGRIHREIEYDDDYYDGEGTFILSDFCDRCGDGYEAAAVRKERLKRENKLRIMKAKAVKNIQSTLDSKVVAEGTSVYLNGYPGLSRILLKDCLSAEAAKQSRENLVSILTHTFLPLLVVEDKSNKAMSFLG